MPEARPPGGVSARRLALITVGLFVRPAAATVFNGIPSNARLHLTVRSRRARRARAQAWADMRERIDELAATVPSLHLLCCRYVDTAGRASRVGRVSLFGSEPQRRFTPALVGEVLTEVYFGTDADPGEVLLGPRADIADPLAWRATHRPGWPGGRWDQDSPRRPLRWNTRDARRDRSVILHTEQIEPADWSIDTARTQCGTLLRWSARTSYLTVHRHPWLRGMQRLWGRLSRSGSARSRRV